MLNIFIQDLGLVERVWISDQGLYGLTLHKLSSQDSRGLTLHPQSEDPLLQASGG